MVNWRTSYKNSRKTQSEENSKSPKLFSCLTHHTACKTQSTCGGFLSVLWLELCLLKLAKPYLEKESVTLILIVILFQNPSCIQERPIKASWEVGMLKSGFVVWLWLLGIWPVMLGHARLVDHHKSFKTRAKIRFKIPSKR